MDTRDKLAHSSGIAIEVVAVGIGGIGGPKAIFWVLLVLGAILLIYSSIKMWKYKPTHYTWQELKTRGENKRWYLDPLLESVQQVIDLYKTLAQKAINFPLAKYNEKYFRVATEDKKNIKAKLTSNKYWINNKYYGELKTKHESDTPLRNYQKWYSEVGDKLLRKELDRLWKCEHQATSNDIFYEIDRINFPETTTKRNLQDWNRSNTKREFDDQLLMVSK